MRIVAYEYFGFTTGVFTNGNMYKITKFDLANDRCELAGVSGWWTARFLANYFRPISVEEAFDTKLDGWINEV